MCTRAGAGAVPLIGQAPDMEIRELCWDSLGRVWMGGDGLYMAEPSGKVLHCFNDLPMIGGRTISALAGDPEHKDGVIVGLDDAGVVYLRAPARKGP